MVRFVEQVAALLPFDASGEKRALRSAFASVVSTPAADEASGSKEMNRSRFEH
jgi:hypothetical protein